MYRRYGEWDIKLKRNRKEQNIKSFTTKERMTTKIILDFLRVNAVVLALLLFIYLLIWLSCHQYDIMYNLVVGFLETAFGGEWAYWIKENSFLAVLALYGCVFVFTCFVYSVVTLINFDKTWRSLSALVSDETEIKRFSKNFSDIEITLKDIRHEVYRSQQAVLTAESKKNDLVMYLAHDLKTPLTSIIGYLSLLYEAPELSAEQRAKYIGITLDKAYRLEELINEFFEITRFNLESITLENNRTDIGMMLSQITDEFYPMFKEKNIEYTIDIKEKIVVYADRDKIARVFDNLLKNAVNYSYENSVIQIGARIIEDKLVIKFRNQCDEIPKEKLQRLFDKFFRLDSSRATSTGGSGLGLAIAKQITELHGGSLKAKSTQQYTDFTVTIPYKPAEV